MEDDSKAKVKSEFVGLKSKIYFLIDVNCKENKKAKGVNSVVVENTKHKKYCNVLLNEKIMRPKMN